jgi:hypothetical protein
MRAFNFHYPVETIFLGIKLMVYGLVSLRGAERCFHIFSHYFDGGIPCYGTIQNWVLTLGLFQLTKPNEYRNDWIYIVDFTIQLGVKKCLVVLGTTREQLLRSGYRLSHHDVTVLRIAVTTKTSGQMVYDVLESLTSETGLPKQILSDHGADVKKGIDMFCARHENIVYTYDITHKVGITSNTYSLGMKGGKTLSNYVVRPNARLPNPKLVFWRRPNRKRKPDGSISMSSFIGLKRSLRGSIKNSLR